MSIANLVMLLSVSFAAHNFALAGGLIVGERYSLGGAVAGIFVNLIVAAGASAYGGIKGKNRRKLARLGLVALMSISPVLIAPVIYIALGDGFFTSPIRWAWSLGWAALPDVAMLLAGSSNGTHGIITMQTIIKLPKTPRVNLKNTLTSTQKQVDAQIDTVDNAPRKPVRKIDKPSTKKRKLTDESLRSVIDKNQNWSNQKIADYFGVSRQAIYARRKKIST